MRRRFAARELKPKWILVVDLHEHVGQAHLAGDEHLQGQVEVLQ